MKKIFLLTFSLFLINCSTIKSFDLRNNKHSTVSINGNQISKNFMDYQNFRIISVDGNALNYGMSGNLFYSKVLLSRGLHTLIIKYEAPDLAKYFTIKTYFQKEGNYIVTGKRFNSNIISWVENIDSGKKISKDVIFKPNYIVQIPIYIP